MNGRLYGYPALLPSNAAASESTAAAIADACCSAMYLQCKRWQKLMRETSHCKRNWLPISKEPLINSNAAHRSIELLHILLRNRTLFNKQ